MLVLAVHEPSGVFEPNPGGPAERLGGRLRTHRPIVAGGAVVIAGYIVMGILLIGLGLILTKVLVGGPADHWDNSVNRWFVAQRTGTLTTVSSVGSALGETLTVIGIAVVVSLVLAIGRHWRELGFLAAGLIVEASVALTTSVLVDRHRPNVSRLDAAPPTASFPSGHTAAAVVLYVSLALMLASFLRNTTVRALAWALAIVIPIFVGVSRLYRGMHHPTDVIGSVVLGAGALLFALLATRTAGTVTDQRARNVEKPASSSTGVEVSP
jgi:membrane-associated phospholipid phosphatase